MNAHPEVAQWGETCRADFHARLRAQYDRLWLPAIARIREGSVDLDPVLQSRQPDPRRGLTLIARPSPRVRQSVVKIVRELRAVEPDQYYYAASELHITVLSLFTATVHFGPLMAKRNAYLAAVDAALKNSAPMRIDHQGITASSAGVMVQGFFETSDLNDLRNELRRQLRSFNIAEGVDQRYRLRTAHMTSARFRTPFRAATRFASALRKARRRVFGTTIIRSLDLVENDWYMSRSATRVIRRYHLRSVR